MSRQYFAELLAPVMEADQSAAVGTAETALWPVSPWTGMVANQLQPGQVYQLNAAGVITTPGSASGTLIITPRWGTTTGGTSFTASAASPTLTVSQTNVPWTLSAMLQCRTIGASGTAVLIGTFECAAVGASSLQFGGPSTTIDTTSAQGIWLGVTLGSASDSMTTRMVTLVALN
jgi:hypothetical protein